MDNGDVLRRLRCFLSANNDYRYIVTHICVENAGWIVSKTEMHCKRMEKQYDGIEVLQMDRTGVSMGGQGTTRAKTECAKRE